MNFLEVCDVELVQSLKGGVPLRFLRRGDRSRCLYVTDILHLV